MGVSVNNAAEAERLFNKDKRCFHHGALQRAKAAATMETCSGRIQESHTKMMETEAMPDKITHRYSTATNVIDLFKSSTWQTVEYDNPNKLKRKKQADEFIQSGTELVMKYAQFSKKSEKP